MKNQLKALSEFFITGVISGRSLKKIQEFVGIDGLFYAGSHGFDITGPNGTCIRYQVAETFLPTLAIIKSRLISALSHVSGATVEDNVYALSVHYRNVAPADVDAVNTIVDTVIVDFPDIRRSSGKMVFELKPAMEWDKGKALLWLLKALGLDSHDDVFTIYIGDDTTDEDVFEILLNDTSCLSVTTSSASSPSGAGLLVTEYNAETKASMTLRDPEEVGLFLEKLLDYGATIQATPQLDQLCVARRRSNSSSSCCHSCPDSDMTLPTPTSSQNEGGSKDSRDGMMQ